MACSRVNCCFSTPTMVKRKRLIVCYTHIACLILFCHACLSLTHLITRHVKSVLTKYMLLFWCFAGKTDQTVFQPRFDCCLYSKSVYELLLLKTTCLIYIDVPQHCRFACYFTIQLVFLFFVAKFQYVTGTQCKFYSTGLP
jgi:hypothetical protein